MKFRFRYTLDSKENLYWKGIILSYSACGNFISGGLIHSTDARRLVNS